mmetsp:Transcript_25308/g.63880  ORF Transcript_25308/g.63880 Transcript_25308/m.63880 type:complete len:159 (+) Transcript_25308:1113-1589(+)
MITWPSTPLLPCYILQGKRLCEPRPIFLIYHPSFPWRTEPQSIRLSYPLLPLLPTTHPPFPPWGAPVGGGELRRLTFSLMRIGDIRTSQPFRGIVQLGVSGLAALFVAASTAPCLPMCRIRAVEASGIDRGLLLCSSPASLQNGSPAIDSPWQLAIGR